MVQWLQTIFKTLGLQVSNAPTPIYEDSQPTIGIIKANHLKRIVKHIISLFIMPMCNMFYYGPALSTRSNLACACARGAGSPRTVKHRYLPGLGRYETLMFTTILEIGRAS